MCSLKTSNTRPSRDKFSSVGKTGSIHSFWVISYKASRRLDAVSSGPKTRKFRDSRFSSITSRKKVPNTLVDSAFSVPGFCTGTAYFRKSGIISAFRSRPPLACGFDSTITAGRKIRKFGNEFSIVIEQFIGLIAPHPVFQDFQVFRLLQVSYRYLVGAPSTFDRLAIHKFRSGPSLGAAQNDHRPERKGSRSLGASFILNGVDFFDNHIEGGRHELVHRFRLVPFHQVRFVSIAGKKAGQLLVGEATKHSRIRDLVAIQVKNGKHRSIARRIEKLVRMPARGEWTRLRLAVTNQGIAQFSAFMDGARCLRRGVAGDSSRKGELLKKLSQSFFVLLNVGVQLSVGAFQLRIRDHSRSAVSGSAYVNHIQVVLFDDPIQMYIDEIQPRCRPPVP